MQAWDPRERIGRRERWANSIINVCFSSGAIREVPVLSLPCRPLAAGAGPPRSSSQVRSARTRACSPERWRSSPGRQWHRPGGQPMLLCRIPARRTRRGRANEVGFEVDLRREATPGTAERLGRLSPLAAAADMRRGPGPRWSRTSGSGKPYRSGWPRSRRKLRRRRPRSAAEPVDVSAD